MTPEFITIGMFFGLMIGLFMGHPLAFVLGGLAVIFGFFGWGPSSFYMFLNQTWGIMDNYILVCIPLFIFMAQLLDQSGVAEELFDTMRYLFGPIRGGMAVAVVVVATLFGACTGIIGASVVTMGLLSMPVMLKYNYDNIIGKDSGMEKVLRVIDRVLDKNIPVLIQGESGTGKELLAREGETGLDVRRVCINDVVDAELEQLKLISADKPLQVALRSDCRLWVRGPDQALSSLIGNLLRNAFSYTDAGLIGVHIGPNQVLIEDSGVGMDAQGVEQAFEPFFRGQPSRRGGHGVGLTIVRRFSDRFHWPVSVNSEPGVGTRVRVEFPDAECQPA